MQRLSPVTTIYDCHMEESHTALRVHVSAYLTTAEAVNVIDFTEERLRRIVVATDDSKRRESLRRALSDFRKGRIALGWSRGELIVMPIGPGIDS